uniref:Uncharacterized protein n=1 Tax=Cryptococcus bacillisporus CA1280 TaxID=1296109 RepID=A0A0D0THP0_CRYGA|nr:hypothetical protein I312_04957 [Cryptococcus bacillisporus CA1280]
MYEVKICLIVQDKILGWRVDPSGG